MRSNTCTCCSHLQIYLNVLSCLMHPCITKCLHIHTCSAIPHECGWCLFQRYTAAMAWSKTWAHNSLMVGQSTQHDHPTSSSSSPIAIWVLNTLHSHLVGQPARMHPALLVAGGTSSSGTKCNLGRRLDPRTGYKLSCGVSLTLSVYVKRGRECGFGVKGRSVRF